jgi:hypothetical protein
VNSWLAQREEKIKMSVPDKDRNAGRMNVQTKMGSDQRLKQADDEIALRFW